MKVHCKVVITVGMQNMLKEPLWKMEKIRAVYQSRTIYGSYLSLQLAQ